MKYILDGGIYDGQRGDVIRHGFALSMNWKIIHAYVEMEDWNQAYVWGERAIFSFKYNIDKQFLLEGTPLATTDRVRHKVYYRMALACKGREMYEEVSVSSNESCNVDHILEVGSPDEKLSITRRSDIFPGLGLTHHRTESWTWKSNRI